MIRISVLLFSTLLLVSCESVYFYGQAVGGELSILSRREDIQKLVADEKTDPLLKARLESILVIRQFAGDELDLPVGKNFSTYVDLGRPFVVWNVFAAPEFSMTPKRWCYPIAGCVTYRGYFSEQPAKNYAQKLSNRGYDVYVGGVAAYSTLGWFSDPVLNTVINRQDYRLASLIFHELAHQLVYIPGDTEFNESFATTVEIEGLKRWLRQTRGSEQAAQTVRQASLERERRGEFVALVQRYAGKLKTLYGSGLDTPAMRREKHGLMEQLRADYATLKSSWNGDGSYDGWFTRDLNNAQLNTVTTYFNRVPAFEKLLAQEGGDLPAFYAGVKALAKLSSEQRNATLAGLSP